MIVTAKPFAAMTVPELRAELDKWDARIASGVFNDDIATAVKYRDLCARWLERREREAVGVAA